MNIHSWKDEQIRWMNSVTNATSIVSQLISGKTIDDVMVKEKIVEYCNFLYWIEPEKTELESRINSAKSFPELDALKEAVVKTDSVSMFNLWNEKRISIWA